VNRGLPARRPFAGPQTQRKLLEKGYADPYGRARALWNAGIKPKCLDVRVLKKTLPRALRIMSALLKTLEARGYGAQARWLRWALAHADSVDPFES
jgi:hypothetical protein